MHYAESLHQDSLQLAQAILQSLDKIQGERFNTLQKTQERLLTEYQGLAIEANYICNLRKN